MSGLPGHGAWMQGGDMDQKVVGIGLETARHQQHGPTGVVPAPRYTGPVPVQPHAGRPPTTLVCVLLCEDREVFRIGLRVVLEAEPDMAVVAETSHLPEALAAAEGEGTVVVVVRQGLVAGDALPLLRTLCQRNTAVLVLRRDEVGTDHFRVWAVIPVLAIASCVLLLWQQEAVTWLWAGVLLLVGVALYLLAQAPWWRGNRTGG